MFKQRTGYATLIMPGERAKEFDTVQCGHCQKMQHVKPFCDPADLGGLCKLCMKCICAQCVATGVCDPFEKKLERAEARYQMRRYIEESL